MYAHNEVQLARLFAYVRNAQCNEQNTCMVIRPRNLTCTLNTRYLLILLLSYFQIYRLDLCEVTIEPIHTRSCTMYVYQKAFPAKIAYRHNLLANRLTNTVRVFCGQNNAVNFAISKL